MTQPGPPLRQTVMRRLLTPSAKTLLTVGALALGGAFFTGWPFLPFVTGGAGGEAEIVRIETPTSDYARYAVRLIGVPGDSPHGFIESDRRNLAPGVVLPVIYMRDRPVRILPIEFFVPWTRPIWLALVGFAALALGLHEKDKAKTAKPADPET